MRITEPIRGLGRAVLRRLSQQLTRGCMWQDNRCPGCGQLIRYGSQRATLVGARFWHTDCVLARESERA